MKDVKPFLIEGKENEEIKRKTEIEKIKQLAKKEVQ